MLDMMTIAERAWENVGSSTVIWPWQELYEQADTFSGDSREMARLLIHGAELESTFGSERDIARA